MVEKNKQIKKEDTTQDLIETILQTKNEED